MNRGDLGALLPLLSAKLLHLPPYLKKGLVLWRRSPETRGSVCIPS